MKILDIAYKDLLRSLRSMMLLGMSLVIPLAIAALLFFAFGGLASGEGNLAPIKVGVVNLDKLPAGAPLDEPLGYSIRGMFFDPSVESWITASDYSSEEAARTALGGQEIGSAVIVPESFTERYLAGGEKIPVTILQDPTLAIGPSVVQNMVKAMLDGVAGGGIAFNVISLQMETHGKTFEPESITALFNRYTAWYADFQRAMFHTPEEAALVTVQPAGEADPANALQVMMGLIFSGQLIFFSFYTGSYSMMSILQESEEGTLERLFTTPTSRTYILIGKFLAVFITVVIQGLVLIAAGQLFFKIQWGEPGAVALSLLGQVFASVGLAVFLVSFIKTSKQAGSVFGGVLTLMGMLSGLFSANIQMPDAFNAIGNFTPQGWALKAWKLSLAGQPSTELILSFIVLTLMGIVMFAIGAAMFKRRFA